MLQTCLFLLYCFVFSGISNSYSDYFDGVVCKLKDNGTVQWSKMVSFNAEASYGSIKVDEKRNVISTFSFGPQYEQISGAIKLDREGNLVWSRIFKLGLFKHSWLPTVGIDDNNNYFFVGSGWGLSDYVSKGVILKINEEGIPLFGKYYKLSGRRALALDYGISKIPGGFVIAGELNWEDIMIIKIDDNGNIIWAKVFYTEKEERGPNIYVGNEGIFVTSLRDSDFKEGDTDILYFFLEILSDN